MRKPRYSQIFAGFEDGEAAAQMAEHANVLWEMYKANLEDRGLWNAARAETLDRLVRVSVEYGQIQPQAAALGPVAVAESGNQYFNYVWSAAQKLNDQIMKLEKSLTLTPESVGEKVSTKPMSKKKTAADEFLGGTAH